MRRASGPRRAGGVRPGGAFPSEGAGGRARRGAGDRPWGGGAARAIAALVLLGVCAPLRASAFPPPPLDRSRLVATFDEEFSGPLDLKQAIGRPHGRWTPCYWFGWRPQGACSHPSSRNVGAADPSMAVDPEYNGMNPFRMADGAVQLRVLKADPRDPKTQGKRYGVGLLTTEGSFQQRYGYFEARIALPLVRGTWPAFWLLPANNKTPQEIDIFENLGVDRSHVLSTAHWEDGGKAASHPVEIDDLGRPHVYGLLWTAEELVWYVDGRETFRTANRDLHDPMYVILSMGVGGWPGSGNLPEDAGRILGASMTVDWMRAYRLR